VDYLWYKRVPPPVFRLSGDDRSSPAGGNHQDQRFKELLEGIRTVEGTKRRYDEFLDLAMASSGSAAQEYFLVLAGAYKPDVVRQRRYLAFTAQMDDVMAAYMFRNIAEWFDDEEHVPRFVDPVNRRGWTNRQQLKDYWQARIGVP
jgi:hypothetical protein